MTIVLTCKVFLYNGGGGGGGRDAPPGIYVRPNTHLLGANTMGGIRCAHIVKENKLKRVADLGTYTQIYQ